MNNIPSDGLSGTALREAATSDYKQIIDLVQAALQKRIYPQDTNHWACVEAIYPDRVVTERDGGYWSYPYSLDANNIVTLGDPVAVIEEYVPATTMQESVLIEAAGDAAAPGRVWRVRAIKSGASINGNYYPDSVLREAVPQFEGARVFVKSDQEHLQGAGKDVRNIIGQLRDAFFVDGKTADTGEVQADLHLLESSGLAPKLLEMSQRGMSGLVGFSIDAAGKVKKRGNLREAVSIQSVRSLDLIVQPSAGGQIISLIESIQEPNDMALRQRMILAVSQAHGGNLPAGLNPDDDAALETAFREAIAASKPTQAASAPDNPAVAELQARIDRAEMREAVNTSGLPDAVKAKLSKQIERGATPATLREAISDERETLAKLTESGHVVGLGDVRIEAGEDRSEKIGKMWDNFFDRSKSAVSLRECYIETTGDRNVTGLISNCDSSRLREAAGANFREAISASTFNDILGDSITRQMIRDYSGLEAYGDWTDLVDIVPIRDFRTNERTRMGGYGNLPAVAENGAYGALTSPTDEKATYAISKRGGTETVSLETIANDDVGVIRRIPMALATAAARTLYEFVLDFLATNPTIYDTTALFTVGHGNLGTAALSATSFAARRLAMKQQTEKDSAKPLGIILKHLYVPAELEETAFDLFVRGTNNDETFVQSRKPKVHVVDYWTDANNWFGTADKSSVPLIELGFYGGNQTPELFTQDLPTQGSLFSNDQIKYKIRHIYGADVLDFRGFDGNIVA